MQHDEPEERVVHRIEAFSDIVIGFSLAELGASLSIPRHGIDLFINPIWLLAFVWAFSLICIMWWSHRRLFSRWFVPQRLPIIVNFAWLAVVVLLVYATQLAVRLLDDVVVWRMYFTLYAVAYGLLALQYALWIRVDPPHATAEDRFGARRGRAFMLLWTAPFVMNAIYFFFLPWGAPSGTLVWMTFLAFGVASSMLGRRFKRVLA